MLEADIVEKIKNQNIDIVGNLVKDVNESSTYYAFIQISRDKSCLQKPSNKKLNDISEYFQKEKIKLSFILVENDTDNIEASIKTSLFRFFPDLVRNVFIEPEKNGIIVWIEPKKTLESKQEKEINEKIDDLCKFLNITLTGLKFTSSENVPTPTACLSIIRRKAPINLEKLQEELLKERFFVPSKEWLSHLIDKLRKTQRLLRRKDGAYVLTLTGLKALGSSKNRKSADIQRALDLARREG